MHVAISRPLIRILKYKYNCLQVCHYSRLQKLVQSDEFGVYKVSDDISRGAPGIGRRLLQFLNSDVFSSTIPSTLELQSKQSSTKPSLRRLSASLINLAIKPLLVKFYTAMDTMDSANPVFSFLPPEGVRGMKTLEREKFTQDVKVLGIRVPVVAVAAVSKRFKDALLKFPKIKPIVELNESDPGRSSHKLFLFDPTKLYSSDSFSDADNKFLEGHKIDMNSCKLYELTLTYGNWTYDQVLDSILPKNCEGIGSFSLVGHIAHLNLKPQMLEFKEIIGQVILDHIGPVTTVVNKLSVIDNTFRNFQMELLAGEDNYITVAKEHNFSYEFDYSKVYWNSRLSTEHQRITGLVSRGDVVYDIFAGVGPFAIPAAKRGGVVFANDLNPESYKWLQHNVKLNKVKSEVFLYNMDGRDFVRNIAKPDLLNRWRPVECGLTNYKFHFIMNLPAIAVDFLDVFRGLISLKDLQLGGIDLSNITMPTVHCYCFSKAEDPISDVRKRTEAALGHELPSGYNIKVVRNVAPHKEMLCVSFTMLSHVMLQKPILDQECLVDDEALEPKKKKVPTATLL